MYDLSTGPRGVFEIGRVYSRAFAALRAHFWTFFVLGLVSSLTGWALQLVSFVFFAALGASAPSETSTNFFVALPLFVVPLVIGLTLSLLIHAGLKAMNGQKPKIRETFSASWSNALPVGTIFIITVVCVILGNFLLFLGTMLLMGWFVAIPARISEKTSLFKSFGRSLQLTRGHRWPLFGFYLLTFIMNVGAMFVVSIAIAIVGVGGTSDRDVAGSLVLLLSFVLQPVFLAINSLFLTSTFVELKTLKEGSADKSIADLFS